MDALAKIYSGLPDNELLRMALYERHELKNEALDAIGQELRRRNIDLVMEERKVKEAVAKQARWTKLEERLTPHELETATKYAIQEVANGAPIDSILDGLAVLGWSEDDGLLLLVDIEARCRKLLRRYNSRMVYGLMLFVPGIALTVVSFRSYRDGGPLYVMVGLIVTGAGYLLTGLARRHYYAAALARIRSRRRAERANTEAATA